MKTEKKLRRWYVLADYLSTLVGVLVFTAVRYYVVPGISEQYGPLSSFIRLQGISLTLLLFPPFMLLVYYLTGYYVSVNFKSRIHELLQTLSAVAIGAIVFFLVVLLNDILPRRRWNYELILLFASVLFPFVYLTRLWITTTVRRRTRRPGAERPYMLLTATGNPEADREETDTTGKDYGFKVVEVCDLTSDPDADRLERLAADGVIDGVVLKPGTLDEQHTLRLINRLFKLSLPVLINPDDRALLMGSVRFDSVTANPLVDISRYNLPDNVVAIKRFTDIIISSAGLLITSPVILALACAIKLRGSGPAFYSQERIGYRRKPFKIHKLRSMVVDSEPSGPMLSNDHDSRITPLGHVMRKYRLDELPNLWNVLKGEMSLVGPRPEREYFINKILETAPHYTLLHLVRPGLTSWGMVKYGYASDVDGMVKRLKYDLLYVSNLSLSVDIRIMLHTILTVIRGEGK